MWQLLTSAGFHQQPGHELLKKPQTLIKKKKKGHSHNIQLRALWSALAVKGKRKHAVAEQVLKNQTTKFRPVYF